MYEKKSNCKGTFSSTVWECVDSYPPWVPCHHEERGHWTILVLCLHTPPSWVFMFGMCVLALLAFCIAATAPFSFAVYVASTNPHNKEPQNNNHDKLVPHYTVRSVTFIHSLNIKTQIKHMHAVSVALQCICNPNAKDDTGALYKAELRTHM